MIQPPETKPVHRFTKNPFHEVGSNLTDKDLTLGTNALAHFYGASVTKEKNMIYKRITRTAFGLTAAKSARKRLRSVST